MRNTILGMLAGAALVVAGFGFMSSVDRARAQTGLREPEDASADIHFSTNVVGNRQQVILFDARQKTLALYEVDLEQSKIAFKSARKCEWDFLLESYNVVEPTPAVIRSEFEDELSSSPENRQSRR